MAPSKIFRSVPQMPLWVTRTRTWLRSGSGRSTSATPRLCGARRTIAFIINYSSDSRLIAFRGAGDVARKSCADDIAEFRFGQQPLMAQRKILDGGDHPHGLFLGERDAEISQPFLHGIDSASFAHHDASRRLANHVP